MAVQEAVAIKWKQVTGHPLIAGLRPHRDLAGRDRQSARRGEFNGSIGLPISSTEISIRDDDGKEMPLGEVGEICARGPQVMAGYWNRPDETAKVMFADNWLRTGDIGRMDPGGFVYIEDRKKDMILVSGLQRVPERDRGRRRRASGRARSRRGRRSRTRAGRGRRAVRREEGPGAHRPSSADRATASANSPATRCRASSSSATSCRRPTSARSCGASCATSCARRALIVRSPAPE